MAIDLSLVHTNLVRFRLRNAEAVPAFIDGLSARGVLMSGMGGGYVRAVTHNDISSADVAKAIDAIRIVLQEI